MDSPEISVDENEFVLIIEDDKFWINYYIKLLKKLGVRYRVTTNYIEAVRILKNIRPQALILDLKLGDSSVDESGWGGWPLAGTAKELSISSIIVTGYPKYIRASRAFRDLNVVDFFSKQDFPEAQTRFIQKLQEAIDETKNRHLPPKKELTKILFLAAAPSDAVPLRLGTEIRKIQERLMFSKFRDKFEFYEKLSVRPVDFSQAMLDTQPNIVHFSGHGLPSGELCFEDEQGHILPIAPEMLAALFSKFEKQVKGVVLNACFSEIQARAIAEYVEYVVGMGEAIEDDVAIAFSVGFYQALGGGRSIEDAHQFGCIQIGMNNLPGYLTPVLIKK